MGVLKPRTATVVLYQGDDLEQLADLRREVAFAEHAAEQAAKGPRRGGDEIPSADAEKAAYDAFVTVAAERAVEVHLEAIGSLRFNALVQEHEPRVERDEKNKPHIADADADYGVNTLTFPRALLTFADGDRRTITGPDEVLADVGDFVDDMSAGQLDTLFDAAYWLNRTRGVDPKVTMFSTGSPSPNEN